MTAYEILQACIEDHGESILELPGDAAVGVDYVGLAIELKRSDHSNKPTAQQNEWLSWLDSQQWRCVVCYGANEAIDVIREYLEMEV